MNGAGNAISRARPAWNGLRRDAFSRAPFYHAPGLAFDQLMVLNDPQGPEEDAFMTIYNQDSSLSASCGNGTRCVAHILAENTGAGEIRLSTSAGTLTVFREGPLSSRWTWVRRRLDWRDIPLAHAVPDTGAVDLERFGLPPASCVSMGNPHAVFFVREADKFDLAVIGPALEHDRCFPSAPIFRWRG